MMTTHHPTPHQQNLITLNVFHGTPDRHFWEEIQTCRCHHFHFAFSIHIIIIIGLSFILFFLVEKILQPKNPTNE